MMDPSMNPQLLQSDKIVLQNLLQDARINTKSTYEGDGSTMRALDEIHDEVTILTNWDTKDLPSGEGFRARILRSYILWAQSIVRNPVDVVFLTHIILYLSTSVPSATFLYCHFTWIHAVMHVMLQLSYCGSFTLMLHNHIHNQGLLKKQYAWFDKTWPYILEPLMGHTWDSYYYHHVKHHHVEGNGPEDLSSTIRYQRDEVPEFMKYVGRFVALIWIELPIYFLRKHKPALALKCAIGEYTSMLFIYIMALRNFYPTLFVLIIPFFLMRVGLMVGNYGQHALVDEEDPSSDFRSSITLIDVPSNRHCFNDGWHTSHHLNPLRHWKDHPRAFMKIKKDYVGGRALVFQNIDYLMMTYRILRKDYLYLADCIVPIGDQIGMSRQELADMLRSKTRKFSEKAIQEKFYRGRKTQIQAEKKDSLYISKI